ncbi:MAG: hypothetical protein LC798_03010 [Chloroflexi bacterium]|nr:hypothetical protein [Chloroflexota bacterium]
MPNKKISELGAAAALTGAEQVPVVQNGTTVRTTSQAMVADRLPIRGFIGDPAVDSQAAFASFLSGLPAGAHAYVQGTVNLTGTVTISANDVTLELAPGASIVTTAATSTCIAVTGTDVTIKRGKITSPATFDATNVAWTYAVIKTTASGTTVDGVKLVNVPRVGIGVKDADDLSVTDCTILGNFPASGWTGTETMHAGVAIDPGASGRSGRSRVRGNLVRGCVQGVYLGNYGAGSGFGDNISANVLEECHNHGVYGSNGVDAATVTGNTFARCSDPIAFTGRGHVVSGNTLYTSGTGNNLDRVAISIRDARSCSVTGNTIVGDAPVGQVIIELGDYTGVGITRNVVSGNVINVTGGSSIGIRLGRAGTTVCSDNIVANNTVRAVGTAGSGLISVATTGGTGNKITGNSVVVLGDSHGIKVDAVSHSTIQNNTVRFEYDAPSAKTLGCIVLNATSRCTVSNNDLYCLAEWGTNVVLRGVWEQGAVVKNRYIGNNYRGDLTKLTSFTPMVLITNTDAYIDEHGPGAPAFYGAPGSRWSREDGGAATSLYIKETANTSATWAAK